MMGHPDPQDMLIKEIITAEMNKIEVPPAGEAWAKFTGRYGANQARRFRLLQGAGAVAAVLLIALGVFCYPAPSNAFGGMFIRTVKDFFVGQTVKNRQVTYSAATQPPLPVIKELGTNADKAVTLEEAEKTVPYLLAKPGYLPAGAVLNKVLLMQADPLYRLTLQYEWQQKNLTLIEQNIVGGMSEGMLYDTDDTRIENIEVNGSQEQLFVYKNGEFSLTWQVRGLHLELRSDLPETELMKVIGSIN